MDDEDIQDLIKNIECQVTNIFKARDLVSLVFTFNKDEEGNINYEVAGSNEGLVSYKMYMVPDSDCV